MINKEKNRKYYNYIALRTTLIYAILSVLWILFSDRLLLTNPTTAVYISTIKGWFYTIIVGAFIYFTLTKELNQITTAENEIKKFQQLLQSSIDSQKDTILVSIDKNYNCLYFNKAFFEVIKYAYGTEIKLGMNILDVMTSDEDRKAAKKSYDRALQGESHSSIRIYGDTNLAYYEGFFNPIINETGEIIGATALARNITERKNMEEKNKWLASFPLFNPWPVIEIDKNVGLVFINDSAKKTFPDLEEKNINHPFVKDIKKYFAELNTDINFQSKREVKIGDSFYLQAITLVNKQQLRIYAMDITDVKKAEEILNDEKEKYQKLFYNMINGLPITKS
jgi:PAS domain S-box-containing protein